MDTVNTCHISTYGPEDHPHPQHPTENYNIYLCMCVCVMIIRNMYV